jgi:hypothetical protein
MLKMEIPINVHPTRDMNQGGANYYENENYYLGLRANYYKKMFME